jgi:hypothetical protein
MKPVSTALSTDKHSSMGKEEAQPPMPSAKLRTLHWDKVNALPNEPMVWNDLSKLLECVFKVLSFLVIIL